MYGSIRERAVDSGVTYSLSRTLDIVGAERIQIWNENERKKERNKEPEALSRSSNRSLPLAQVIDDSPYDCPAIRSRNAGQCGKKRSVSLRACRFYGNNEICHQFRQRNKDHNRDYPTPRPARPEDSQKHAGGKDKQSGKQQIIDRDIGEPCSDARQRCQEIAERIACARGLRRRIHRDLKLFSPQRMQNKQKNSIGHSFSGPAARRENKS
jgi:hypothetical protein